jgi:hypothetical protein
VIESSADVSLCICDCSQKFLVAIANFAVMIGLAFAVLAAALATTTSALANPQFGAMEAMAAPGISPRYFLGGAEPQLKKRNACSAGSHHCTCYFSFSLIVSVFNIPCRVWLFFLSCHVAQGLSRESLSFQFLISITHSLSPSVKHQESNMRFLYNE